MFPPRAPPRAQAASSSRGGSRSTGLVHPDDAIRGTDDDAASSRLSAVGLGYLADPFVTLLYKPARNAFSPSPTTAPPSFSGVGVGLGGGGGNESRKAPLINVGTHHRTWGIDRLVDAFFERGGRQVVSLGAGSDTRFWRLMSRPNPPDIAKYVEIDFPHLTSPKAQRIARSKKLHSLLGPANATAVEQDAPPYTISKGGAELVSPLYTLLPLDLRSTSTISSSPSPSSFASPSASSSLLAAPSSSTPSTNTIPSTLTSQLLPHLDPALPTLFLAECVFCYMQPGESEAIIRWFGETFENCMGVVYEMCGLHDSFGSVMRRNLSMRNLSIPGSEPFPTPQSQVQRFTSTALDAQAKFSSAGAKTLWQVRQQVIDPAEIQRISKLEFLDEIEELRLVLDHYIIAWGTKGSLEGIAL